jgi:hypothetical protein
VSTEAREAKARTAKTVFDSLAAWQPPPLGELSPSEVKSALLKDDRLLDHLEPMLSREERQVAVEWQRYCRTIEQPKVVRTGSGLHEYCFPNVYDLLLYVLELYGEDKHRYLYRGHYDDAWKLRASANRAESGPLFNADKSILHVFTGDDVPFDDLSAEQLESRLTVFHEKYPAIDIATLSPIQQQAVVQHYVSGTKLIDVTDSLYVAAFFATLADGHSSERGAIYDFSRRAADQLLLASIELVELPSRFARLHRQEGAFLRARLPRELEHPANWIRWVFDHCDAASPFQCEALGVTSEFLLPEEIAKEA